MLLDVFAALNFSLNIYSTIVFENEGAVVMYNSVFIKPKVKIFQLLWCQ